MDDPVQRLRAICFALPDVVERESHGEVCFFVALTAKNIRQFVSVDDHHHGSDRLSFWCPAPPGAQEELVAANPDQFFRPPYVGHRGWVGVRIDQGPDWTEIAEIVTDAYSCTARPAQIAQVDPVAKAQPKLGDVHTSD